MFDRAQANTKNILTADENYYGTYMQHIKMIFGI